MDDYLPPTDEHIGLVDSVLDYVKIGNSGYQNLASRILVAEAARLLVEAIDAMPANEQPPQWSDLAELCSRCKHSRSVHAPEPGNQLRCLIKDCGCAFHVGNCGGTIRRRPHQPDPTKVSDLEAKLHILAVSKEGLVDALHERNCEVDDLREKVVALTRENLQAVELGREQQRRKEYAEHYPTAFLVTHEEVPQYPAYLTLKDAEEHGGRIAIKHGWRRLKWALGDTTRPYPKVWELTAVMGSSDRDDTPVKVVEMPMLPDASTNGEQGSL